MYVDSGQIQFVLKHLSQILSHLLLLRHSAVVLYGQDHWVPGGGWGQGDVTWATEPGLKAWQNTSASAPRSTYCDFVKAYLLIVSMTSLKRILDVKVYPWWIIGSPSGPSQQSTDRRERKNKRGNGESPCVQCRKITVKRAEVLVLQAFTLHTATAGLQNIGIHFHSRLREQLVSCQVGVVWGGNEVVIQRLRHVLVHLIVLRIKYITCRAPHEVCKAWREKVS